MKKQYQEEKTCACCGKTMYVLHPSRWAYKKKRGSETYIWFCSYTCMRMEESMGRSKLTAEQKKKAVEIASQGGDQLEYLRKCGAKNPSAAWFYIKKTLEVKETEKKAEPAEKPQLAEVVDKVPEVHVATKGNKTEPVTDEDEKLFNEMFPEGTMFEGFYIRKGIKVTGIESEYGNFSITETGRIKAEVKTGTSMTVIILTKAEWIDLISGIESAMKIFAEGRK